MASSLVYGLFKKRQMGNATANPVVDLDADTIKVALVNATYTAIADATKHTHEYFSDVSADEVSGTGYTAGGVALASKTSTETGGTYTFDAADSSWASATLTATGCVIYKDSGTPTSSPLIAYLDFGGSVSSTSATFTITYNAAGIFTY